MSGRSSETGCIESIAHLAASDGVQRERRQQETDCMPDLSQSTVAELKAELERRGFVVLQRKSYEAAQRRQANARSQAEWERERREGAEQWAHKSLQEERRLRERLNEVIHLATRHGMTTEDLIGFNNKLTLLRTEEPTFVIAEQP